MSLHERRAELVAQMADLAEEDHRLWTERYINTPKDPQGRSDGDDALKAVHRRMNVIEEELVLIRKALSWRSEANLRTPQVEPDEYVPPADPAPVNPPSDETGSVRRRGRAPRVS